MPVYNTVILQNTIHVTFQGIIEANINMEHVFPHKIDVSGHHLKQQVVNFNKWKI